MVSLGMDNPLLVILGRRIGNDLEYDPEIERTARANRKVVRLLRLSQSVPSNACTQIPVPTLTEAETTTSPKSITMGDVDPHPPRPKLGDYGLANHRGHLTHTFQPLIRSTLFSFEKVILNNTTLIISGFNLCFAEFFEIDRNGRWLQLIKWWMDQIFECVVHHAGDFSCFMDLEYVGPEETLDCDLDFFSYFALLTTLKRCGYVTLKSLWYFDPALEDGMVPLNSDSGCRRMQSITLEFDRVHLYVVHPMSQPDVVALDPLIEYPCMTSPVPPVVNETNVGPTGEGKDADSGVSGVTPYLFIRLFY
ncbi:hypothetical protein MTR_0065s0130 [Medicago truncatula]|uniref:PB1-like domain-containing protein n=1 Tax=Medicago truncatula TaxID=3880 RepID=A0A072TTR5_MEDTR|nr:hypothetical protein MTR_0065s0130 [Medicago truncatula]